MRSAAQAIRARGLRVMHADLAETKTMALLDRGGWARVPSACEELADALAVVPMALWEPLPPLIKGRALLGLGDCAAAAVSLDDAHRRARRVGADGTVALSSALRAQAKLLAGTSRTSVPAPASADGEAGAVADETDAIAAVHRGDHAAAIASFDRAVERWQALGTTSWLARALAMRARALGATGDRARAAASLDRARAVAAQLSMPTRERAAIERGI
jgi:hypothetical protein